MVARAKGELGPLRIAINNAGIAGTSQPTGKYDVDGPHGVRLPCSDATFRTASLGMLSPLYVDPLR